MLQSDYFNIFIEVLPPGINKTYSVTSKGGKGRMYKSEEAKAWATGAALQIGSRAAELEFEPEGHYDLKIIVTGSRMDVDAPIKLIQDTLCQKLDFDE